MSERVSESVSEREGKGGWKVGSEKVSECVRERNMGR